LSGYALLQPNLERRLTKWEKLQTAGKTECVMQFFAFPLNLPQFERAGVDVENLTGVEFKFNLTKTGVIAIDNVGFM
jgi:hypothetical protein